MARLQELSATLLDAVTPSDVAQALVERVPALVGARGASFGLIDGSDLVIVDPRVSQGRRTSRAFGCRCKPRLRSRKRRAGGAIVHVEDRETFERDFPDGAALTLYAQRAIAVPVTVAGEVVGALSFLFDEPGSAHEEAGAIAALAAGLGGQALERARLYEGEQEARRGLDRILRVSPRFHADSVESAAAAICGEAAATFGADTAILWRLRGRTSRAPLHGADRDPATGTRGGSRGLPDPPRRRRRAPGLVRARRPAGSTRRGARARPPARPALVLSGPDRGRWRHCGSRLDRVVDEGHLRARPVDRRAPPALRRPGRFRLRAGRAATCSG